MSVALWTIDTLSPLCAHESEDVRVWAVERLGRLGDVAALPQIVSALDAGSPSVVSAAVTAIERLGDLAPTEVIRASLQRVLLREGNHWGAKLSARTLLLKRHDPDTVEATVAQLLNGGAGRTAWRLVAREEPARLWDVMQREVPSASEEVRATALTVQPMVCPVDVLPSIFAGVASLDDEAREELMNACLWRCGADQCSAAKRPTRDDWAEIIDDIGWAYIDERDEALVNAWLSVEAFRAPLDAFAAERWRDVISWSASRVAVVGGDDERAVWSRALAACLGEAGEPTELDARTAMSLAIGAGTCAIERERPFSARSLEEQFAGACRSAGVSEASQRSVVTRRWRALGREARERAALNETLVDIVASRDVLSGTNAFEIAATLPGLRLDASLLDVDVDTDDAYVEALERCLEAQPESLRALAPAELDGGTSFRRHLVLGALKAQNERWAAELLAPRLDALLRGETGEFVLEAARGLGDPALLAPVVAAWRPGETLPATTALHIAQVNGLEKTLPDALRRDAEQERLRMAALLRDVSDSGVDSMLDKFNDAPLSVELVCNRCGRSAHYQPGRALLHPDLEACKREGWDGVTFERIIVCKFCNAEDDYTLGTTAMLAIMAGALGAMLKGEKLSAEALGSARLTIGVPGLSDGTHIRRASDGLRHWRAKIDKSPPRRRGVAPPGQPAERQRSHRGGHRRVPTLHRGASEPDRRAGRAARPVERRGAVRRGP